MSREGRDVLYMKSRANTGWKAARVSLLQGLKALTLNCASTRSLNELQAQSNSEMQSLRLEIQSLTLRCEELSTVC